MWKSVALILTVTQACYVVPMDVDTPARGAILQVVYVTVLTMIIAFKSVSHAINSHVLSGLNPCIIQAIHVLLIHCFCTLHIHILGCHKN